ncbi:Xaa-Pro aminopeptidase, family M24 [Tenacibaculum maritimum]|nr:Xaa-Pro aminopeptidase, family M24 [Tenacibaculum maritimum]
MLILFFIYVNMIKTIFVVLLFIGTVGIAQTPTDYLSKEFHKERRGLLRAKMPKNSVAIFFSNSIRNRANDVDYIFHQDPNFYYLTGHREPNAVLLVYSDKQKDVKGNSFNEVLYVQKKDPHYEMWNGKRLGVQEAKEILGFSNVKPARVFLETENNFKKFDKVFVEKFKNDHRNLDNNADVYDLVKSFKEQSGYDASLFLSPVKKQIYELIKSTPIENSANVAQVIRKIVMDYPDLEEDEILQKYKTTFSDEVKKELKEKVATHLNRRANIDTDFLTRSMAELREVKSREELKLLTKAIRISAIGQIEVMKAMKPHMSEAEIQGIHEFVYKKYGAEHEGYPSIVGAGNNGCVLHYIDNNRVRVGSDLVLMDLGAEYRGYTADVTRTIPANGKFSEEQRTIYNIVLKAQNEGIAECKIGNDFWAPGVAAKRVINKGLTDLGILKSEEEAHNYFPHGTSHHIGLDVHDPGTYGKFQENMVITVEPGIYIPEGSPCDKKWWGIGVRIEDDILITKKGAKNLSQEAPREVDAIEKMMDRKSILDNFVLPALD